MAFTIIREDLARVAADAIVVPANSKLMPDGGVSYAVAKAAGYRRVRRACKRLGGCEVGHAAATPAFDLPAEHIIHAVGPVWRGGTSGERALLFSAYSSALELALRLNAQSVALPLISAGTFGYPMREAFEVAIEAIRKFLDAADMDVMLVLFDKRAVTEGSRHFGEIAEYIDDAYAEESSVQNVASSRWVPDGVSYHGAVDELERLEFRASGADVFEEDALSGIAARGRILESTGEFLVGEAPAVSERGKGTPRFCPMCGDEVPDEAVYCAHCGYDLQGRGSAEARYAAPAPSMPAPAAAMPSEPLPKMAPLPKGVGRPRPHIPRPTFGHAPSVERIDVGVDAAPALTSAQVAKAKPSLSAMLSRMDAPFSTMLMELIDARGLTDAQVYKRANITRQHFSKMRNPDYRPTKKTVVALAVALELPLPVTRELLARAGFALSHSSKFDIIVEYFISRGEYDIFAINEALFAYDQPVLS